MDTGLQPAAGLREACGEAGRTKDSIFLDIWIRKNLKLRAFLDIRIGKRSKAQGPLFWVPAAPYGAIWAFKENSKKPNCFFFSPFLLQPTPVGCTWGPHSSLSFFVFAALSRTPKVSKLIQRNPKRVLEFGAGPGGLLLLRLQKAPFYWKQQQPGEKRKNYFFQILKWSPHKPFQKTNNSRQLNRALLQNPLSDSCYKMPVHYLYIDFL